MFIRTVAQMSHVYDAPSAGVSLLDVALKLTSPQVQPAADGSETLLWSFAEQRALFLFHV